jgi:excisionase family DNA binding protein
MTETPQEKKLLYTRKEAAATLSMSVRMLDYFIATRKLKAKRFKRSVRIHAADLERFAQGDYPNG